MSMVSCLSLWRFSGLEVNECLIDIDDLENACGVDSDCINRLTQVECLPDDCRCGSYCRNQR